MVNTFLRQLRIEHDQINGKQIGSLTISEKKRMAELRDLLADTEFEPWGPSQTQEAYESIYLPENKK